MKLGIVAVYMVAEENERLLDLHLERLERHTVAPFAVYGSTNRLLPQFQQKLAAHPRVHAFELPPTEHRSLYEHSYYLEYLVQHAWADDCTHVAVLHVDSFPIADGWDQNLLDRLAPNHGFVTLEDEFTACLFFSREFYDTYDPRFLPPDAVLEAEDFCAFCAATEKYPHSGIGYLWTAHQRGVSWAELKTPGNQLYDDLFFHFRGVMRDRITPAAASTPRKRVVEALYALRRRLPKNLGFQVMRTAARSPVKAMERQAKRDELRRMLADFEVYLDELRAIAR